MNQLMFIQTRREIEDRDHSRISINFEILRTDLDSSWKTTLVVLYHLYWQALNMRIEIKRILRVKSGNILTEKIFILMMSFQWSRFNKICLETKVLTLSISILQKQLEILLRIFLRREMWLQRPQPRRKTTSMIVSWKILFI